MEGVYLLFIRPETLGEKIRQKKKITPPKKQHQKPDSAALVSGVIERG